MKVRALLLILAPDTVANLSSAYTVSAFLAASLSGSGKRQFEAVYLKELNRRVQNQPELVQWELNLNEKQLAHVHRLSAAIKIKIYA
ncbi:MAG: hypothetical protein ACJAY7_000137 [Pseudohongiellaceae bacterium]|jgi:hypothetical protein